MNSSFEELLNFDCFAESSCLEQMYREINSISDLRLAIEKHFSNGNTFNLYNHYKRTFSERLEECSDMCKMCPYHIWSCKTFKKLLEKASKKFTTELYSGMEPSLTGLHMYQKYSDECNEDELLRFTVLAKMNFPLERSPVTNMFRTTAYSIPLLELTIRLYPNVVYKDVSKKILVLFKPCNDKVCSVCHQKVSGRRKHPGCPRNTFYYDGSKFVENARIFKHEFCDEIYCILQLQVLARVYDPESTPPTIYAEICKALYFNKDLQGTPQMFQKNW